MPNVTNLATTTAALTVGENKIPNIINLVKLKIKSILIIIMINILLLKNLIN